jgi:HEPN domain-containing protein/predicted nucleotidyltransferase
MVDFIPSAHPKLERMVTAIRDRVAPELILLFGSRARGDAREDSDYDLLLVLRDDADVERERSAAYAALRDVGLSADVLASSVSDYQRWQHDPGFLDWLVAREGVLLYSAGNVPQRSPLPSRVREQPREGLELWIERAEQDFRSAEALSQSPVWDAVCFHSHACVEKLLKGLIVKQGVHPLRTHELRELLALQAREIREDVENVAACALLQELYPKSRYPEAPMPTPAEGRRALEAARLLRGRLLTLLQR